MGIGSGKTGARSRAEEEKAIVTETVTRIPLEQLRAHPANRRVGGFDQARLEQLAESIRTVGVQQPAVVRPKFDAADAYYEIVAGERRWRASKLAGVPDLPCIIRELDDVAALKIQTIENLQREDVHPLDEADGYKRLMDEAEYDVDRVATDVGKSVSYVYQRLKLLELAPIARGLFVEGTITAGHAILLARLRREDQEDVVKWIRDQGRWSGVPGVRSLSDYIQRTVYLELAKATFKKDDETLVPEAGPCTLCPKRTGYTPALFADVGKDDYCLDRRCFEAKINALVALRRDEAKAKVKNGKILEVTSEYLSSNDEKKLQEQGILTRDRWEECKAKDGGATRVLIVNGREAGKLTWGKERKVNAHGVPAKSDEQKQREKAEREKTKRDKAIRVAVYEEMRLALQEAIERQHKLPIDVLRALAFHVFDRIDHNTAQDFAKLHGFDRPPKEEGQENWQRKNASDVMRKEIEAYQEHELLAFLVQCLVASDVLYGPSSYRKTAGVDFVLEALGADAEAIRNRKAAEYDGKEGES